MNDRYGFLSLSLQALLASLMLYLVAPAMAQDDGRTSTSTEGRLEEVMVTARRMEESLREVPASVAVITTETLEKTGINSVDRIVNFTPGVSIVTNTAEVGDTQINIRGINGARDAENNVALVVDGILKTNTAQIAQIHGKLTQAEVLKGPQGAYYGRNAAAGAIVLTTKKPGESLSGNLKVSAGQESTYAATAMIDGPVSEKIGMVFYADYKDSDGFYRNTSPVPNARGATVDSLENTTAGARIIFQLSDSFEFDIKARFADFNGAALSFNPTFHLPGFAAALGNPLFQEDVNDHSYDFIGNVEPKNNQETKEFSIKGDWTSDNLKLTAWALYSDVDQEWIADSTAATFYRFELQPSCRQTTLALVEQGYQLPQPQLLLPQPFTSIFGPFGPTTCDGTQYQARAQEDFSAEVRLSSVGEDAFSWSLGAYFLTLDRDTSVSIAEDQGLKLLMNPYNPPGSTNPTSLMFADSFKTDVYAVFGSIDYDLTDRLTLSAALRFDREEREVSSRVPNVLDPATGAPINPGLPAEGTIPDASRAYEQWQPKVSLGYVFNDAWNIYANWGVGFKAGGFNNQGSEAVLDQNFNIPLNSSLQIGDTYDKETSSAFEVGAKGSILDGSVSLEFAAFYSKVNDMQFFEFFTGTFGLLRVVSNIDDVEIYGFEGSFNANVSNGWDLFGSFALNESEIKKNNARPNTEGNESPYTPDYTVNLGAQYTYPINSDLELTLRADWRLTGPTWFHTVQDNVVRTTFDLFFPGLGFADYSQTRRDAYDTLDLRIELAVHDSWRLALFGYNVLDEDVLAEVIPSAEFGGSFVAPGARRLLGVELGYSF